MKSDNSKPKFKIVMFQFSLQVALDVRSRQEKIKMKELAEALAIEQQIVQEINQIHQNTADADQNLDLLKRESRFTIDQLKFLNRFKARMKNVLAQCHQNLKVAKEKVGERQKALIEASKARKTLEILKEKEFKRFQENITRMERRSMDEIAGNLFIQQKLKESST